jgi:hypothetical protein
VANLNSASKARGIKHRQQALDLRRAGLSYDQIAQRLKLSKTMAHKLVQQGMESARAQIVASADEVRTEELSRLDGMLLRLYPKAVKGDVAATDRVIKIGERRAKLLGLDAPTRTALQGGGEDAPPIATTSETKVTFYMPANGRD